MRVSRIHIDAKLSTGQSVQLPVDRAHYVKNVLRLQNGDALILFNGVDAEDYQAQLRVEGKHAFAELKSKSHKLNDSALDIRLLQALGRSEHNDYVIQKGTELGVSQIMFFNAERTQSPLKPNRLDKKLSHWNSIAISACEQCDRNLVPNIGFARSLDDYLQGVRSGNGVYLEFEGQKFSHIARQLNTNTPVYIAIGPEGGFNQKEIQQFTHAQLLPCNMGPRVLRMETAAISALTLVQHYLGDM
jgi:16S rRNA (uracil1498-N3)-methyltransferase